MTYETEFEPFTDEELAGMDDETREVALRSAKLWWAAETKRRRKADKRVRDRGARDEDSSRD